MSGNPLLPAMAVSVVVFTVLAFFLLETPSAISRRVRRHWPRSFLLSMLYWPGPGRLYAYLLVHVAGLGVASVVLSRLIAPGDEWDHMQLIVGTVLLSLWSLGALSGSSLLARLLRRFELGRTAGEKRPLTVPETLVLWIVAGLLVSILAATLDFDRDVMLLSPGTGLFYLAFALTHPTEVAAGGSGFLAYGSTAWVLFMVAIPGLLYWVHHIGEAVRETKLLCRAETDTSEPDRKDRPG